MALFAWTSAPENVPRSTQRSDEIPSAATGWSGQNYAGYRNPKFDAALEAAEKEPDAVRRGRALAAAEAMALKDYPWVPLRYLYPQADVPVIQLSLQSQQPPAYHYQIGQLLAPLAREGVLLVGSGSFTHNLRELRRGDTDGAGAPHTLEFLPPPGNQLEALTHDRSGQYSIRINRQWRVCFRWTAGGPENVEIVDYH